METIFRSSFQCIARILFVYFFRDVEEFFVFDMAKDELKQRILRISDIDKEPQQMLTLIHGYD